MPNELIATLIKFLPTIVFGLIVLLGVLGGFLKGFRKSSILFVHYLLALGVGFAAYFILRKQMSTMDLNFLFGLIGGEYSNAHTVYDFIRILIEQTSLASYSALVGNYYIQGVIDAFAGLIFSLVLGILCLIVLPILLRIIFRFFYIIFYSERKHKKHKRAEGEEYRRHRFLGMGVGLLRGAVCATLMVSFITSLFFTISGGEFTSSEEEANIELFNYLESTYGADVNLYYNALKQSRNTGVGLLYEKVQVKGKPLDYFYYDLFLATDFKSYDFSKDGSTAQLSQTINQTIPDGVISTLSIRQESALVFELIEGLLEANVITMENGAIKVHNEVLFESGIEVTKNYVEGSVFFKDIMPLVLTGIVDEAQKGNISIQEDIDKYIKENDLSSKMRKVDFVNDISQMLNTMIPLVEILVDEQTGQFNTDKLSNPLELLNLAPDVIDTVLNGLSEITLITEVIFPIGIGYVFNSFEVQLNQAGIATDDIDLLSVDWKLELKNLAKTFKCISQLELDFAKLQDTTIQPSGKTMQMEYITNFIKEEANKTKLLNLVDTVMASNLTGQFSLVMVKKFIGDLNITDETGAQNAELAGSLQKIKDNLNARDANGNLIYTTKHLASDLHVFVDSCLGLFDLIGAFSGDTTDPIGMLKGIPTDSLRVALIGDEYDGTKESVGGLYKIQFLSGDLNGDGKVDAPLSNVTDEMIETLLLVYAKDVFSSDDIKEVKNGKGWPEELDSLIKCIEVIQGNEELSNLSLSGDLTAITLSDTAIDDLTLSCSKSVLIGNLLTTKIKEGLSGEENNITIPENTEWLDTFDETGNLASRGELNKMLKILNVFNDPKNGIDLNNSDSIVAGLAKLNTEEVDTLTASTVLTGSLNGIMCEMLELEEGSLGDINWASEDGKEGELQIFVNILNISVLQTKEEGSEVSKFDAEKLTDVDTIAQLIKTTNDEDKYQDAEQIAKSQVVMSVISDKISSISSSDVEIVIPQNLNDNWQAWSKSEAGVYKDGEFIKMVYSLHCARNYVLTIKEVVDGTEQNKYTKLTTENLIEGILGMPENTEEYSPVTESLVMYATLSNKLDQLSKEENPTIQIREAAYVKEEDLAANNNIAIYKEEVSLALCAIGDLGITDLSDVKIGSVIEKIGEDSVREKICKSNILNETVVDKLVKNSGNDLTFGTYVSKNEETGVYNYSDNWYPTQSDDESWISCELNKVLVSVNELDINVDNDGNIKVDSQNIIYKMNDTNEDEQVVVDVIFDSYVMSHTITMHIDKYKNDGTIQIREDAYTDSVINSIEIITLVDFLEGDKETTEDDINLDDKIKVQQIFDKLENDADRERICKSNVLNITVVDKLVKNSGNDLTFGTYVSKNEETGVYTYSDNWYPTQSDDESWISCELNKVLVSVNELDINADNDGNIKVDSQNIIYKMNDTNEDEQVVADVIFDSYVMSHTITMHIDKYKNDGTIQIREDAYTDSVINSIEIITLVDFLEGDKETTEDDINLDEKIKVKQIFDKLENDDDRERICKSNILNETVVDKLVKNSDDNLIFGEYAIKDSETGVYTYSDNWYPTQSDDESWISCELNKLLVTIVDLNIGVDETTDNVKVDLGAIICDLHIDSRKVEGKDKIDVAYDSGVMIQTINKYLNDNIGEGKDIQARESAYYLHNDDVNKKYMKSVEISLLSLFLDATDLSIESDGENNVTTKAVLDKIKDNEEIINIICSSNILNITLVGKIISADGLALTEQYDSVNDSDWYFADEHYELGKQDRLDATGIDCELKRMLISVNTLNLKTAENDSNKLLVDSNELINELKSDAAACHETGKDKKISIVYNSRVFAKTFSVELLSNIAIPEVDAQGVVVIGEYDIISNAEVTNMVTAIGILGLDLTDNIDGSHAIEGIQIQKFKGYVDDILLSATIHYMISDELIYKKAVTTSYYATNDEEEASIIPIGLSTVAVKKAAEEKNINVIYVKKAEIEALFNGFIQIDNDLRADGSNGLSLGGALNTTDLIQGLSQDSISKIYESTLLSYLFSHSIIEGTVEIAGMPSLKYYQAVGLTLHSDVNYYVQFAKQVNEINYLDSEGNEGNISIEDTTTWDSFSKEEVQIILTEIQNMVTL